MVRKILIRPKEIFRRNFIKNQRESVPAKFKLVI